MEIKRNHYLEQLKWKAENGKTIRIDTEIGFIVNAPLGYKAFFSIRKLIHESHFGLR